MKLLVVGDHPLVREELAVLLQQVAEGTAVLQARGLAEALRPAGTERDLAAILLDLESPGQSGTSGVAALCDAHPGVPVIVLSASERPDDVRGALAAGARGYIPKSTAPSMLLAAVRLVLAGGTYIPPLIMLDRSGSAPRPPMPLTPRQVEILRAISLGLANKEIAARFSLSEKTVKAHVSAVFRALNVVSRTQAAEAARRLHLLE